MLGSAMAWGPSSPPPSEGTTHALLHPCTHSVTRSLGRRRLLGWGDLYRCLPMAWIQASCSRALGAGRSRCGPRVLSLWGEAARGTGSSQSTQQTVTCGEKTPSPQEGWSGGSLPTGSSCPAGAQGKLKRQATAVPRALAGLRDACLWLALRPPPGAQ